MSQITKLINPERTLDVVKEVLSKLIDEDKVVEVMNRVIETQNNQTIENIKRSNIEYSEQRLLAIGIVAGVSISATLLFAAGCAINEWWNKRKKSD